MKKTINNSGRRIGIASMAIVMTLAVPFTTPALAASGEVKTVAAGEDKNTKETPAPAKKSTSFFDDAAKIRKILAAAESAAGAISKTYPAVSYVATPLLTIIKTLYNNEHPEVTLDTVSAQLTDIKSQIQNAKQEMISAMSTVTDMNNYVEAYNEFDRAYREMSAQISQISGYKGMDQSVKDTKLAGLIGTRNDWLKHDNVISAHTILGDYLSANRKLSSGNKTIYDAMITHYSKSVLFGREAIEKTDGFVKNAVAIYMEGTVQLINCLVAEKNHLVRLNTESSKCDAEYCEKKIESILKQVISVNEALKKYRSYNPFTFYDRSGGTQKDIVLTSTIGSVNLKNNKDRLKNVVGGNALSKAQMEYIIKYVKTYYPKKTFHEFLQYLGYKSLNSNDYLMTDVGDIRSVSMNIGVSHTYYFHGFRLNENKDPYEVSYLSKTVCLFTDYKQLANANLVYLKK